MGTGKRTSEIGIANRGIQNATDSEISTAKQKVNTRVNEIKSSMTDRENLGRHMV